MKDHGSDWAEIELYGISDYILKESRRKTRTDNVPGLTRNYRCRESKLLVFVADILITATMPLSLHYAVNTVFPEVWLQS